MFNEFYSIIRIAFIQKDGIMTTRIKQNYLPRVIGFLNPGIIGIIILHERNATIFTPGILIFVIVGILWPHLAYFIASKSKDPKKAELRNLMVDSFFVGMFISFLSFSIFPLLVGLVQILFINISMGGIKLFLKALFFLIIGSLVFLPVNGLKFIPDIELLPSILSVLQILLYIAIMGSVVFKQTNKLIEIKRIVAEKNFELQDERNKLKLINEIFEYDISLAKRIQDQLIPKNNPGENIHSLYKPMEEVGGDFYDFIYFRDTNKIGIFISDVSGHGISAAFITSMLKTTIIQSGKRKENPAELFSYINDLLQNQTGGNFITAFYGIFNLDDKSFLYSNAGHPQPYLITESGIKILEKGKNTALALFSNNHLAEKNKSYINFEEILPENSKLILYTDGFTEACSIHGDKFFESEKMMPCFIENKELSPKLFIEKLHQSLISFREDNSFDDDVCLVCLDIK